MKRLTTTTTKKSNMIGSKLREFRMEQNISQQALSERLETEAIYICRGSISRIEDGSRTVTDLELYGLSKILCKPIEDFLRIIPHDQVFTPYKTAFIIRTYQYKGR